MGEAVLSQQTLPREQVSDFSSEEQGWSSDWCDTSKHTSVPAGSPSLQWAAMSTKTAQKGKAGTVQQCTWVWTQPRMHAEELLGKGETADACGGSHHGALGGVDAQRLGQDVGQREAVAVAWEGLHHKQARLHIPPMTMLGKCRPDQAALDRKADTHTAQPFL